MVFVLLLWWIFIYWMFFVLLGDGEDVRDFSGLLGVLFECGRGEYIF